MKTKLGETYTSYRGDKLDQLLMESTSNDNWQISNQKQYELADETAG